jgi:hypothetical protein
MPTFKGSCGEEIEFPYQGAMLHGLSKPSQQSDIEN